MQRFYRTKAVVFEIETASGHPVYMKAALTPYMNDKRAVVLVDAAKFLALWRADPFRSNADIAFQAPATWPHNYKYPEAAAGFARGAAAPVPLALVSCLVGEGRVVHRERHLLFLTRVCHVETVRVPYVGFTNGITRTIWLLATVRAPSRSRWTALKPPCCTSTQAPARHHRPSTGW
ncbi:hypothetical protein OOT46_24005 [Aquabacterium sp. A7-Y]|uniref:plasmid fertility inhibition factor family protein n=1 Tax=Aquabacterium sp. A7-Y TaxID=1349605 RepID=UPI00223D3DC8|nr:hypothetical protein [Aquabacterium sp. A7-Y]MCW7540890.1 hypothetical protein [Aquabacterium sp. A7-Y]